MLVAQSILLGIGVNALEFMKFLIDRYFYNDKTDVEKDKLIEVIGQESCACTLDENGLKFWPPLYMQRYMAVQEILEHNVWDRSIKKVVDFGCAEFGLFKCLKPIPGINHIILVDIDSNTLDINQCKVLPTNYDHISMHQRREPLVVEIYNGSIADKDDRMLGVDAVICIELIEHLHLDVLDSVPETVFGFIKPKLAVFTTPNVEFNIVFPNFSTKFRHPDHKFEWNRKQFKKWAKNITTRYPEYIVQFDGIGAGPPGTKQLGCCTQMAIFYKTDMQTSPANAINSTPYKLLRRVDYPYEISDEYHWERSMYEKLDKCMIEVVKSKKYLIDDHRMEIPLEEVMPHLSEYCSSIDVLRDVVDKIYYTKKNDQGQWLILHPSPESSVDGFGSDSDSSSNHSGQEISLLEDTSNINNDNDDWNVSEVTSSDKSKLCFSTPMTNNQEPNIYFNNVDSLSTVDSNSDLYKTATDHNKSKQNMDMDISSSCNSSIIVDDCKVYQDFRTGRNISAINEEDINETDTTLTCIANSHSISNESDKLNDNKINDNTIIENNGNNSGEIIDSNLDMYKTAVDYTTSKDNIDMEISSSFNGSNIVDECKVYQDFRTGRNNSIINEEDIDETNNTLICFENVRSFSSDSGKLNDNLINDNNPIIKNNGNISSKQKSSSDAALKFKSNNPNEIHEEKKDIDNQPTVCLNRTLLDENDFTENLLSTSGRELKEKKKHN